MTDSKLFKFKWRFLDKAGNSGTVNVTKAVLSKQHGTYLRTFEIPLINYAIDLVLNWLVICFIY